MSDEKSHMNHGMSGASTLQVPNMGGYPYDSQFMKHMAGTKGMIHADIAMTMPRYTPSANMMMKNELGGSFDSLSSHPGLRMQLPSHESLLPQNNMKFEDVQSKRSLMPSDHDGGTFMKSQRRHSQVAPFSGNMNYNNGYAGNGVNYNMVSPHQRVPDIGMSSMMRYSPSKEPLSSGMPKLDMDVGQMTGNMTMPPLTKPPLTPTQSMANNNSIYSNNTVDLMTRYQEQLRKKEESQVSVRNHDTTGGVIYDKGPFSQGGRWLVFWECRGRIWRKSFLVNMYGVEGAKELAEQFWFSKMRAMQLFNSFRSTVKDTDIKRGPETNRRSTSRRSSKQQSAEYGLKEQLPRQKQDYSRMPDASISKEDPEVFWDPDTNSWCFEHLDRETKTLGFKHFPVENMNMIEEVRLYASQERAAHWREVIKEYSESEYCGHTYEKSRTCWRVSHWVPSKLINRNRYFNITKYGYIEAKEKSKLYRILVYQLGGEEPDMPPPDTLPDPEFLELPLTKFYHRVLYSMRNKDKL